jgi:hypothetical protein
MIRPVSRETTVAHPLKEQGELVAAKTRYHVTTAQALLQAARKGDQQLVPRVMPYTVAHGLKVI